MVRQWRMRSGWRLASAISAMVAAFWLSMTPALASGARLADRLDGLPDIVYTQATCVSLWSLPNRSSTFLADVIGGTALRVTGISTDNAWYKVLFLSHETAWVPAANVGTEYGAYHGTLNTCPFPGIPAIERDPLDPTHGPFDMQAAGTITQDTELRSSPDLAARVVDEVSPGARAYVEQYAGDDNGDIWYLAHVGGSYGWLWAYALLFDGPDPGTHEVNGQPLWSVAAGKGMWFTDYLPRHTDIGLLVDAAKASGITHLYTRVAESTYGFFDESTLDRLLPAAHAAGIKVIPFVYPYLYDVATDLAMTKQVLDYQTPSGDKMDGLAADIEERTDTAPVFAYGQVLRQMVGPDFPLIVTTYNPRGRPSYPYPEVAASFNVISPQDYWHSNQTDAFTAANARALLTLSVTTIRAQLGRDFPIEELGQMYDMFTASGAPGGSDPSPEEITGDLQAAKDLGCIGASFFEWQTASPQALDALTAFKW